MDILMEFISTYGLGWITLFAVIGIVLLGIMKYCNLFKKIAEGSRHYIYLAISIGFSVVATLIYLLIAGQFTWVMFIGVVVAVFALNQTFYNIFKVTPVNRLFAKILDFLKALYEKHEENKVIETEKPPENE
ncbi:MAG: hypothetical protein SPH68_08350 [Candidatus Borkfalkiaceae bacterium]|nr:hypothetical protein [Clostridia bacterium]MDY6224150.1 hypothetical protein [Christensenellaceae bacterium]